MPADVSAPLPQLDLDSGTIVTVTFDDPNAVIVALNVHGFQDNTSGPETITVQPLWLPVPAAAQ